MADEKPLVSSVWWTLRLTFGIGVFVAGLDKFFNLLVQWDKYVAPVFERMLPGGPHGFMYLVGIIEMGVGVLVLFSPWQRVMGWIVAGWLWCISFDLLLAGYFDIAVRDIIMGISAACLARLTVLVPLERRERLTARVPAQPRTPVRT